MTVRLFVAGEVPRPEITGAASDLVTARFGMSEDLVAQYDSSSNSALSALANADYTIPLTNSDLGLEVLDQPNLGDPPLPTKPDPYESQISVVDFPDITALRALLDLVDVTVDQVNLPALEAITPTISLPDAPDDTLPTIPDNVPTVSDPSLPATPSLDLPAVPVLDEIALPAAPTVDTLAFEGTLPTADLTAPEPMFIYSEATYQSDLADAMRTKLYNDVTLGGTGLAADVEQAIWDRAIDRLDVELEKSYDQVLTNWGAWGFEMPDGALSSALTEVINESTRERLNLDRDIAFKQAELAQQNTQFAITNGLVYEKQIMDFTNQVAQRAFEVARTRVQAVIDVFNLKVSAYSAQMDGYKALAQVFENRIRAELAKVELYRAQMEGAKVLGDLQVQKVQIYTARVGALQVLIDLYRAQMEGAKLQVDVDKAKIEGFKARLDAVVAQIGAVTAKYNLYQAQIAGETAKVDLYSKQVSAYATRVEATKIESDINITRAQALIESNKEKIAVLSAAVDRYKADTQYQIGKEEANSRAYSAQVEGYSAEVRREQTYVQGLVDNYKAKVGEVIAHAELIVKEADSQLMATAALKEVQVEALKAAASILAQKTASALASVSASAQVGYNEGLSNSFSGQLGVSTSYNNSGTESEITSIQG